MLKLYHQLKCSASTLQSSSLLVSRMKNYDGKLMYYFLFQNSHGGSKEATPFDNTADKKDAVEPIKKKRSISKKTTSLDSEEEITYNLMKMITSYLTNSNQDESTIFGEMVAVKIRKLNPRNRAIAQNKINNLLFDIEMQELNNELFT